MWLVQGRSRFMIQSVVPFKCAMLSQHNKVKLHQMEKQVITAGTVHRSLSYRSKLNSRKEEPWVGEIT